MKVIVRRTGVVFEALNNHMTSACGGLVRLGVKGLGVRAAMGDESKARASIPSGVRKPPTHHARCITVYARGRNCILRSGTLRPWIWPYYIARTKLF